MSVSGGKTTEPVARTPEVHHEIVAAESDAPVAPVPLPVAPEAPEAPSLEGLVVGHAKDQAEIDADKVAARALARLRRKEVDAAPGLASPKADRPRDRQDRPGGDLLLRSTAGTGSPVVGYEGGELDVDTSAAIESRRGSGEPLEGDLRRRMEHAFGANLSKVRIHSDGAAAKLNTAVSAQAFTTGSDVFFGAGQYAPSTPAGEQVLAHELAHTLQPEPAARRTSATAAPTPTTRSSLPAVPAVGHVLTRVERPVPLQDVATSPVAAPRTSFPRIRRRLWTYDGTDWKMPDGTTGIPDGLPPGVGFEPHDAFDDVSGNITHGRNASVRGEPGRFFGYDEASAENVAKMRNGLAVAKQKLHAAIVQLNHEQVDGFSPRFSNLVDLAFNTAPDLRMVGIIRKGLERVTVGLNSDGLDLVVATQMRLYGTSAPAKNCTGWVLRGITEMGDRATGAHSADDLGSLSSPIHLKPDTMSNANFVANTILHEAMHKFLGAFDYSYVGSPGGAEATLQYRSGLRQGAPGSGGPDAATARQQVKGEWAATIHMQVVSKLVQAAVGSALPLPGRNDPPGPADSPQTAALKAAWKTIVPWSGAIRPTIADVSAAATAMAARDGTPSTLVSSLNNYVADPTRYLAENLEDLNLTGPEALAALPTPILLKNADSWTELVTQIA